MSNLPTRITSPVIIDGYKIDLSAGATTNQVLQYNGTSFVAGTVSGAGGGGLPAITSVNDTTHTTSGSETILYTGLSTTRVITGTTSGSTGSPTWVIIKDQTGKACPDIKLTFTPSSGTIDGLSSITAVDSPFGQQMFICDGTNWYSIDRKLSKLFFNLAEYAKNLNTSGGQNAGGYTNGVTFNISQSITVYGVRFWFQNFTPISTKVSLWDSTSNTRLALTTMTPTQNQINDVYFSSPYQITTNLNHTFSVTVYDGTNQILYPTTCPFNQNISWGPGIIFNSNGYASGDNAITSLSTSYQYAGIEPIYSIP